MTAVKSLSEQGGAPGGMWHVACATALCSPASSCSVGVEGAGVVAAGLSQHIGSLRHVRVCLGGGMCGLRPS